MEEESEEEIKTLETERMPVCRKCHRFKSKRIHKQHQKKCIPSDSDMDHYLRSKTGGQQEYKKTQKSGG